jgi:uncharacterized protein
MADGVLLATDIWRGPGDRPRPTLLRRTPYGRAYGEHDAQRQLDAGYVFVSQDVRGRGNSAGEFSPFSSDEADARATLDWIAAQPWSNGKVGTFSGSAEGVVQFLAMAAAPEPLRCAHVSVATHDVYAAMLPGGAWRTDLDTAWLNSLGAPGMIDEWKAHEVRDAYWDASTLSIEEMEKIDHPVFMTGGFFDIFAPDESRAASLLPQHVAPGARPDVFVVLGPWTHGSRGPRQGQLLYPDSAALHSDNSEQDAFFAWCLQGAARPAGAAVRYYITELSDSERVDRSDGARVMLADGGWRDSALWPPAGVHTETLFLAADNRLGPTAQDAERVELPLDPANPMPSRGGGNFSNPAGPHDQAELDRRRDVYVAATLPLPAPVELVGTPRAFVWAASATDDIDVVVRFEQVTANGKVVAFADGVRRGRFVHGYDAIRPLVPGEPALFELELGPIALRVREGSALRIAISGASNPRYEPNPNHAAPLATRPAVVPTTLSIFRDPAHPSRLELPVLLGEIPGAASHPAPPAANPAKAPPGQPAPAAEPAGSDPGHAGPDAGAAAVEQTAGSCGVVSKYVNMRTIGLLALLLALVGRRWWRSR